MAESHSPSTDPDQRLAKKRALSPVSRQAASLNALFKNPSKALAERDSQAAAGYVPPEIVTNVQGSSAGAGSGEFFVYKAARRREYDRLAAMDAESEREKADAEWEAARREREEKDRARGAKSRARRDKKKLKRAGGGVEKKTKLAAVVPIKFGGDEEEDEGGQGKVVQKEDGITIHDDD